MYRLNSPTVGIVNERDKWVAIAIPAGALIDVIGENLADGSVDIRWNDQCVNIFRVDLDQRGQRVEKSAPKSASSDSPS